MFEQILFFLRFPRLDLFKAAFEDPGWRTWPFGFGGEADGFWPNVAKAAYVLVIFSLLILVLRKLFGPGGRLRPKGFDTIQEAQEKELRADTGKSVEPPSKPTDSKGT